MRISPMPAGVGKVLKALSSGGYNVQTPDSLWPVMIARMKAQVSARESRLAKWEARQAAKGVRRTDPAYWRAYDVQRALCRVDYPMPWGHVMFESR